MPLWVSVSVAEKSVLSKQLRKANYSPLLETTIDGAEDVIKLTGGLDMTLMKQEEASANRQIKLLDMA